jgi:hypothetical protein
MALHRFTDTDLIVALNRAIDDAGGLRKFARQIGLSPAFVSIVSRGEAKPGPRLAEALGFAEDGKRWVQGYIHPKPPKAKT